MPKRNVATNYTFEQQRQEINLIAADLWDGVLGGSSTDFSTVVGWGDHGQAGYLKADGTVATTAAFTFGNKIVGPSTFTIEPTNVNGTVVIAGNLQVDGTQTAVNSTTMDVTDLNITVAKGAANAAAADTAGITVDGANATLQYEDGSPGTWESSLGFRLDGRNASAGLTLNLAGTADYLIKESTTDDIVQFGGTGAANFFAHNLSSGNFGIARANPGEKLEVSGSIGIVAGSLKLDTHPLVSTAGFTDINGGSYAARIGSTGSSTIRSTQICGGGNVLATFDGVNTRLGIGTTTPDRMLHLSAANDASSIRLSNTYDTPDNVWEINPGISGISNTGFCIRDITDSANRLVIDGDGNIAIGHNAPVKKLDIRGTGTVGLLVGSTDDNGAQVIIDGAGGGDASGGNYGALEVLNNGDFTIRNHDASQSIIFGVGSASGANNTLVLDSSQNATFAGILDAARVDCNGLLHIQYGNSTNTNYMSSFSNNNGIMHLFRGDGLYIGDNMNTSNQAGGPNLSKIRLKTDGTIESDGEVSDWKGRLRRIPQNYQASNYQLVASDSGKHILADGNITWVDNTFAAGDAVTILNATGGDITITKGSTMFCAIDGLSADRTLSTKGIATILFTSSTAAYISGAGLS